MTKGTAPILYSLHNCPYAIRARFALLKAQQCVLIRSIKLDNKPSEMLEVSPKGSVPVLVIPNRPHMGNKEQKQVLEESLDIMIWALSECDPNDLLNSSHPEALSKMLEVIGEFESHFVPAMNAFGCAKRYHEDNADELRKECESDLFKLESLLTQHSFLFSERESLVDIAILPFIRKYARIDKQWLRQSPYPNLKAWLNGYIQSPQFSKVMKNYDLWLDAREEQYFCN
ncbi:glutathione S-transferase [Vibrio owensii]|uniref:glutathione S-transferase n=1 Tax=Vibrio owensii TaxID=696485 RepID=UPI00215B8472|nr:glutathione S-transferase [Vibrio owensii]MCR9942416.1 glutathione S-transferase [Vibrio owensii]